MAAYIVLFILRCSMLVTGIKTFFNEKLYFNKVSNCNLSKTGKQSLNIYIFLNKMLKTLAMG